MKIADIIQAVIMLTGIVTICFTIYQFVRQLRLSLFEKYTARYQHIMEIMPEYVLKGNPLPEENNENAICAIRLYIDLCSEEFYLYQHKYLDEAVWKEWKEGMKNMFNKSSVQSVFEDKYQKDYKDFAAFIVKELTNK